MKFSRLIYFYLVLLFILINPNGVVSRKGVRESGKPPFTMPSTPAINAVLLECPRPTKRTSPRADCERQMMVHIRVSPTFQIESLDKFLLLDEVYDQRRQAKAKLMAPYLIEISRGEPVIMYPLEFAKAIRCDTCGHKNATTNSNGAPASCDVQQPLVPIKTPANNIAKGTNNEIGSVASSHPLMPAAAQVHPARSAAQHEKRNQEQQCNDNDASMEGLHISNLNPSPMDMDSQQQQQQQEQKLSAPAADQSEQNPANVEEYFPLSDLSFHDVDDSGMEYEADEYDERNMNYDTLTGRGRGERGDFTNAFRNKRLKSEPNPQPADNSPADAISEAESLFQKAERQGEEARLGTINAFKLKHPHLIGTVIGTSAASSSSGSNDAGLGPSSAGKPHVAGIQEDSIRPQEEFDVDGGDNIDVDVSGGGSGSRFNTGQRQNFGPKSSNARLHSEYGHQVDDMETQKMTRPHLAASKKTQAQWPHVQFHGNLHGLQEHTQAEGDFLRENTFSMPSKAEISFPSPSKGLRLWQLPQQRQEPDDSNEDATKRRQFPFTEDIEAQGGVSDSHVGRSIASGSNDADYSRLDASVSSVGTQSKSNNIAKIDDTETMAGGMGDEFYWNTLNYPQAHDIIPKDDKLRLGFGNFNTDGKFNDFTEHETPKRLSSSATSRSSKEQRHGSSKMKKMMNRLKPQSRGSGADIGTGKVFQSNQRHDDSTARKGGSQDSASVKLRKAGSKTKANLADKSLANARMKIRSSDAAMDVLRSSVVDNSNYGDSPGVMGGGSCYHGSCSRHPSNGAQETYVNVEPILDTVIPTFPLNGYPGYLGAKTYSTYIQPTIKESHYKVLENVPAEYLPAQPQFAKEIADPNLTVNDKINLLEVLTAHDEANDAVLRRLENELDNSLIIHDLSNHDRMPMPSPGSSGIKGRKALTKRSYLMYDDLFMRDTYDQYDDMDPERPGDEPFTNDGSDTSAATPCKSCQGKKCKTMSDNSCICDRNGRNCKCNSPQNQPKSSKKIRSVSEAWYSVFNTTAPLQFLTTRVGIYRKRHGAWWRIAPSITLTSLSGIYANGNLSILFSSHVDIFQLRRPLSLKNHKLLVPRDGEPTDSQLNPNEFESIVPEDILAIDSSKFDFNAIHDDTARDDNDDKRNNDAAAAAAAASAKGSLCEAAISAAERRRKRRSHSSSDSVLSIGDLGAFPGNMNILEQCPNDKNHLCLNLLDEEVPSFTVKIKQPFLENGLIFKGDYNVRIASVISDATTKGALQVAVGLVNEGYVSHEFAICISECPMTFGAKTMVKKELAPHSSETISFLLPLEDNKDKKLHCKVEVKSPDQKVISKRQFTVEPTARCLCIWDCECHCIQELVSHDDYNVCHKLTDYEEHTAGFMPGDRVPDHELTGWRLFLWRMNQYAFNLLLGMLFLGFLKAIVGALGSRWIDRCGYNYVQPLQKYEYASRCRRFFINILFFVVLPFIFCCKCFTPTEEDLLIASTEWQFSVMQTDFSDDSSGGGGDGGGGEGGADGAGGGGWRPWKRNRSRHNISDNDDDDEETILSQRFESGDGSQSAGIEVSQTQFKEYLMNTCDYDEAEEERDTNYVLQALTESRESIRKLLNSHCGNELDSNDPRQKEAEELVRKLVAVKIVYRKFDAPLNNVEVPEGQKYSIKGYFVPSVGPGYQYFTPSSLVQRQRITANKTDVLSPPVILRAEEFTRVYASKCEVLEAGDLSVDPPEDAPCINCRDTENDSQLFGPHLWGASAASDESDSPVPDVAVPSVTSGTTQPVSEQPTDGSATWKTGVSRQ